MNEAQIHAELDSQALAALVKDIGIPPRPSLLVDMQNEVQRDEPRMRVMADIAGSDVAMSAALLKTANSPLMGLRRRAETIEQAFMLLGYAQCHTILTELTLRKMLPVDGPSMERYWDVSTKRAQAMTYLSRTRGISTPGLAHTLGLFIDVGIPMLLRRFTKEPRYLDTLAQANTSEESITGLEQARHYTDHTFVGSLVARTWGVSQTVVLAVRMHHDYAAWSGELPYSALELMALALVSEYIIQRYEGLNQHVEWQKGGEVAKRILHLQDDMLLEWCEELHDRFNSAH